MSIYEIMGNIVSGFISFLLDMCKNTTCSSYYCYRWCIITWWFVYDFCMPVGMLLQLYLEIRTIITVRTCYVCRRVICC